MLSEKLSTLKGDLQGLVSLEIPETRDRFGWPEAI